MAQVSQNLDCGGGAIFVSYGAGSGAVTIYFDGDPLSLAAGDFFQTPCAGAHTFAYEETTSAPPSYALLNSTISPLQENMLMGFAGIVCAMMVAWALLRSV